MKLAIALGLALGVHTAGATVIGAHLATWHDRPGMCNLNPGLYVRSDSGLTLGAYHNSDCRTSVYAGNTWEWGPLALTAGLVVGYKARPVLPALVPSVALPLTPSTSLRVLFIPRVEKRGANAVHLMIERRFPDER